MTSMVPPISTSMEADIFIELLVKRHLMVEMPMTDFRHYTDLITHEPSGDSLIFLSVDGTAQ